ncbi:MAG: ELWxxDGT repeat-containing protein, partial [Verrucomicrobiaceae bacterium]|nr:ELWxxDGT repeat-containing protein [Verrucomicrobiaceae bacterium]
GALQGTIIDQVVNSVSVPFSAQVNPWNATTHKSPLAATYTARLSIADPSLVGTNPNVLPPGKPANAVYPQGGGYATVAVTAAGGVTWIGKMGDGSSPATTYTTTLAADGTFPVHLALNAGTGASQGIVTAAADMANTNNHLPLLDGTLDWSKNMQPFNSTDRTYKNGIPLFNLTVAGGQYVVPAAGTPVLGLPGSGVTGMNNIGIRFTDGGLTTAEAASLARALRITPANAVDLSNPAANTVSLSLSLNATTGAMTGGFTLTDGGATRHVTYTGLLVPRLSVNQGVGYFLLPALPNTTTSALLSGMVVMQGP